METEIAAETLLGMGCTTAQGFLYSRPLPAEDFAQWITAPAAPPVPSAH